MRIHIFTLGGTIDKVYPSKTSGFAFELGAPAVPHLLSACLQPTLQALVTPVAREDSTQLSKEQILELTSLVESCAQDFIIIVMGTSLIVALASWLERVAPHSGKRIVLTGAYTPAAFIHSDAAGNLAAALTTVQMLEPGQVRITLSCRCLAPGDAVLAPEGLLSRAERPDAPAAASFPWEKSSSTGKEPSTRGSSTKSQGGRTAAPSASASQHADEVPAAGKHANSGKGDNGTGTTGKKRGKKGGKKNK